MHFCPRVRVAVVIPSRCMESSSCRSLADAIACASRAAWEQSPVLVCAAIARALPSGVLAPELPRPPWNWHFWVLLTFRAGRPHWSPVVFDLAVHRAHTSRPPAVVRRLVYFMFGGIGQLLIFYYNASAWGSTAKLNFV